MNLKLIFAASVCALAISGPARADEEVKIAPPADWVVKPADKKPPKTARVAPAPETAPADSDAPVKIIGADYQVRLEPDRQITYSAFSMQFLTPQGLAAGNLSLPWDPATQTITVHEVHIKRGSVVIDVLGEGQTFTVLRREQGLELAMLDGDLTANLFPAGLEVGDTLEFSYTLETRQPVLKGHAEASLGPLNAPLGKVHLLFEWPEGLDMHLSQPRDLPAWQRSKQGGMQVAQLTVDDFQPLITPHLAPARYSIIRMPEATDFSSWDQVSHLLRPLYVQASQIPTDGKLHDELEKIRAASDNPLKRAELALDLVQDKIRYVALSMGAGGLVPADAATTWTRRFGDCKGKTVMLLGLLRELGIEAEPVLVNTAAGDALSERPPMVFLFDHVLVRAVIGGHEYWLDGTRSGDRTLAEIKVPAFGWGLPLRDGPTQLARMMPEPLTQPTEDLAIHIDASGGLRLPAPTEIENVLRGDNAIGFNNAIASLAGNVRKEALERYWHGEFAFVTPEKIDARFDPASGEMHLTLSGTAEMDWNGVWYETDKMHVGFSPDFARADGPGKDAPFAVAYPFFTRAVETIVLPAGFTADQISGKPIDETVAGIEYHREAAIDGTVFKAVRTSRSIVPEFAAADAPAAAKRLTALNDEGLYLKMPSTYRPNSAELAYRSSQNITDVQGLIDRGVEELDYQRYDEALADFDRAVALAPDNPFAAADRGMALVWKHDPVGAEQAFLRAEKLDPDNAVVNRGRGVLALQAQDFGKAEGLFRRSLEIEPDNAFAHFQLALALFGKQDLEGALGEARQAIKLNSGYGAAYSLQATLLMNLKRPDEAAAAVDTMVKTFPKDSQMLTYASNLYDALGKSEKSEQLLKTSLATEETPLALVNRAERRPVNETEQKLADLTRALQIDPKFVPALIGRGNVRWMEYQLKPALSDVNQAIAIAPDAFQAYDVKAKILADMERKQEAAAVARQLIDANPQAAAAYFFAANIYDRLGMAKEAKAVRDKQVALPAQSVGALLYRNSLRERTDLTGREQDIEAALTLDPGSAPALIAKSQLQEDRDDWPGAAESLAKARIRDKTDAQIPTLQGIALVKANHTAEAAEAFDASRKLATTAQDLNTICFDKVMRGVALERAVEECDASLQLAPDKPATLDSRGLAYLRLGKLGQAKTDYDRAIDKLPGVANPLYGRAVARALSGDLKGAREDAAAALRISPQMEKTFREWGIDIPAAIAGKPN
ncbi:MAG: tetratricopeptide repeat protein [Candidatus Andeanibacterium colombiense]|uniref:Tetratricopeptide repeat protein n=1 Tax=Candidatus Andeanibacterium colombiense TaxID=3121345 RepID=A0AAJ5X9X0_9SPHN|nr:MAG: tetratricopeptide repeat protein [Sphingomonadaceae bacterium]